MSKEQFFTETIQKVMEREFDPQETLQWLKLHQLNFMSWGVSKMLQHQNKSLFLKVNGFVHSGWVMITLAWNDTYTVRLLDSDFEVFSKNTQVYCDQLCDTVDFMVESNSEYYS